MTRRTSVIYLVIGLAWILILAWQAAEHSRVRADARTSLVNRGRDITSSLGLLIRSQRRFGNIVSQERLEPALRELIKSDELLSVALLNVENEVVASAGDPIPPELRRDTTQSEIWTDESISVANLVDLGSNTNPSAEGSSNPTIIVMPRRETTNGTNLDSRTAARFNWWPGNRPPPPPNSTNPPPPGPPADVAPPPPGSAPPSATPNASTLSVSTLTTNLTPGTNSVPRERDRNRDRSRERDRNRPPGRPPWMDEAEYASLLQKQGLHRFVIVISTHAYHEAVQRDLIIRVLVGILASVAAAGITMAWRNQARSAELELRLVRASELNHHLRELNTAAAGLAHETRNPLNIIRGIAQIISRQPDASQEVRLKSRQITDEVDRVTAQLNEFINYSKPRDVRRTSVELSRVLQDLARALECDLQEKQVTLEIREAAVTIHADEQLVRQMLFNLLLNAIQAVEQGGQIEVHAGIDESRHVYLEISDNGPGVPPDNRQEIFKPYFTNNPQGTGLGLAIVMQIVLAHGWEVRCLDHPPRGATFRVSHMDGTLSTPSHA